MSLANCQVFPGDPKSVVIDSTLDDLWALASSMSCPGSTRPTWSVPITALRPIKAYIVHQRHFLHAHYEATGVLHRYGEATYCTGFGTKDSHKTSVFAPHNTPRILTQHFLVRVYSDCARSTIITSAGVPFSSLSPAVVIKVMDPQP